MKARQRLFDECMAVAEDEINSVNLYLVAARARPGAVLEFAYVAFSRDNKSSCRVLSSRMRKNEDEYDELFALNDVSFARRYLALVDFCAGRRLQCIRSPVLTDVLVIPDDRRLDGYVTTYLHLKAPSASVVRRAYAELLGYPHVKSFEDATDCDVDVTVQLANGDRFCLFDYRMPKGYVDRHVPRMNAALQGIRVPKTRFGVTSATHVSGVVAEVIASDCAIAGK